MLYLIRETIKAIIYTPIVIAVIILLMFIFLAIKTA